MGRMIHSEMWGDEFFTSMSMFDRLLWTGLITACADDQGRLQDSAAMVRSNVFPVDDIPVKQISDGLDRFQADCKIVRYTANGHKVIQIVNWWKHQKPQWAGKSIYPPCEKWIDRLRYHVAKNEIITVNWDKQGGFPDGYIATYIDGKVITDVKSDVKGEVKIEVEVKNESEKDLTQVDSNSFNPPSKDDVKIWNHALGELRSTMSKADYETWINPLELEVVDGSVFKVRAANKYAADWVRDRCGKVLSGYLSGYNGHPSELEVMA